MLFRLVIINNLDIVNVRLHNFVVLLIFHYKVANFGYASDFESTDEKINLMVKTMILLLPVNLESRLNWLLNFSKVYPSRI